MPDERERLVLGDEELAIARTQLGDSVRSGVSTSGEEYRIVAVPVPGLAAMRWCSAARWNRPTTS